MPGSSAGGYTAIDLGDQLRGGKAGCIIRVQTPDVDGVGSGHLRPLFPPFVYKPRTGMQMAGHGPLGLFLHAPAAVGRKLT